MIAFSWAEATWRVRALWLAAITAALLLTRWPLAPRYLTTFDSVNFALALEKFDPLYHQPQPPGYPLFVALSKMLHWVFPRAEDALLLAGVVGGALAVWLLWWLGDAMLGAPAGAIAALLLLVSPPFWRGGLIAPVRIFLATSSVAVALAAWRAWQGEEPRRWFWTAAILLGLGAGFRPELLLLLRPLVAACGLRSRQRPLSFLVAAGLLAAAVASWLVYLVFAVGGPREYIKLVHGYLIDQSEESSPLAGASVSGWWGMIRAALEWKGMAVLPWLWALPFVWGRRPQAGWRAVAPFLALWIAPAVLFHVVLHLGSPGHILASLPALCLLGGWVLSRWRRPVWALAAGVSALLFFLPPPTETSQRSSYTAVRSLESGIPPVIDALRELRARGPVFLIISSQSVPWRHFFYYFPDQRFVLLRGSVIGTGEATDKDAWLIHRRAIETVIPEGEEIALPGEGRIVLARPAPDDPGLHARLGLREHGPLLYFDARPGMRFQLGSYKFATAPAGVPSATPAR